MVVSTCATFGFRELSPLFLISTSFFRNSLPHFLFCSALQMAANIAESRLPKFESFNQQISLTVRINEILAEYPDGSQVLREILQNSDDAGSTEQVFLLDYRTHPVTGLIDPVLADYQGPSLLAMNDSTFREADFKSLTQVGNSLKREDLDKAGRYGVGFNSVYHMTDVPMFISGDKFVVLDPHQRVQAGNKEGGIFCKFVDPAYNFSKSYPSQCTAFSALVKNFDRPYNGTVFRYPLRTKENAERSQISKNVYKVERVIEMFDNFQHEAAECLIFLKYLEKISFYKLGVDDDEPRLLYEIRLLNNDDVRESRQLLVANVKNIMATLDKPHSPSNIISTSQSLSSNYIAEIRCFSHKSNSYDQSNWMVQNHLGDVLKADQVFFQRHRTHLKDNKLIPWVGVSACLSNAKKHCGRLFCFLPLPISTPFKVHIHGFFSMSSSRRELPVPNQDNLNQGSQMAIKGDWNEYLFKNCIPQAWADMLIALAKYQGLDSSQTLLFDDYIFWPLGIDQKERRVYSRNVDMLWRNLLEDVLNLITKKNPVFRGMRVGLDLLSESDGIICKGWTSLEEGLLEDEEFQQGLMDDKKSENYLTKALSRSGQLMIPKLPKSIQQAINDNNIPHTRVSPSIASDYLRNNIDKWPAILSSDDKDILLSYIISDKQYQKLYGLPLILLANGSYTSLDIFSAKPIYVASSIEYDLFDGWKNRLLNRDSPLLKADLKVDLKSVMVSTNLQYWSYETGIDYLTNLFCTMANSTDDTIPWPDNIDQSWLGDLWKWIDHQENVSLDGLGQLWLIPTNQKTLRKVHSRKPTLWHDPLNSSPPNALFPLLVKLGCTFIHNEFLPEKSPYRSRLRDVVGLCADAEAVLKGIVFRGNLTNDEVRQLKRYFATYIPLLHPNKLSPESLNTLKSLPIFPERNQETSCNVDISSGNCYAVDCTTLGEIIPSATNTSIIDVGAQDDMYLVVKVAGIPYLDTAKYLGHHVVPFMNTQNTKVVNALIFHVLEYLLQMTGDPSLIQHLKNLSFITVGDISGISSGETLPPVEAIDRDAEIKELFLPSEQVFPAERYATPVVTAQLRLLGINTKLNCRIVIGRITCYAESWAEAKTEAQKKTIHVIAEKFLHTLDRCYSDIIDNDINVKTYVEEMEKNLRDSQWIPATSISGLQVLSTAIECRGEEQRYLISKVMSTVDIKLQSKELRHILGWDTKLPIEIVVQQLLSFTEQYTPADMYAFKDFEKLLEYLNGTIKFAEKPSVDYLQTVLREKAWIPIGTEFYKPCQVALSIPSKLDLKPFLMTVPPLIGKYEDLFKCLGISEILQAAEMINVLQDIKVKKNDGKLSKTELKQVISLLTEIAQNNPDIIVGKKLYAPAIDDTLVEISVLTFNDITNTAIKRSMPESSSTSYVWCHNNVSIDLAEKLSIRLLSQNLLYESGNEAALLFDSFEESGRLNKRISNILREYTDDSLFFEFLQNADNAKARKFCLIFDQNDYRSGCVTAIPGMAEWQGPALWIYNDSQFSEKDFIGLTQLGRGTDASIGKSGLGFTVSYHYTDVPSIISGNNIMILDPHRKWLPKQPDTQERPAGLYRNFVTDTTLSSRFEDQFRPYRRLFDFNTSNPFNGTLFRFPLRTREQASQSELSNKAYSVDDIYELLLKFKNQAFQGALLFLKNIENIEVYEMDNGRMKKLWMTGIQNMTDEVRSKRNIVEQKMVCITAFRLTIQTAEPGNEELHDWLITTGLYPPPPSSRLQQFAQDHRYITHVGVAGLLKTSQNEITVSSSQRSLFSFLPLPIHTQLSVHLHGCFALTSNRRSIICDAVNPNQDSSPVNWNKLLLGELLPKLHLEFLQGLAALKGELQLDGEIFLKKYFSYWPYKDDNLLGNYCRTLWNSAKLNNKKIFYTQSGGGKWISYKHAVFEDGDMVKCRPSVVKIVNSLLVACGVNVVSLSEELLEQQIHWRGSLEHQNITPRLVRDKIRRTSEFVETMAKEQLISLFEYILSDNAFSELEGCTIMPLMDQTMGTLGDCEYYMVTNSEIDLFPDFLSSFVAKDHLSPAIILQLSSNESRRLLRVKSLQSETFCDLLEKMLPSANYLLYDNAETNSIPNKIWLNQLWDYIEQKNMYEETNVMRLFEKIPILPTIGLGKLVSLSPRLSRIFHNYNAIDIDDERHTSIMSILTKTGTNIIDGKYSNLLSTYVLNFSVVNIIKCISQARAERATTFEELLSELSLAERETLRNFLHDKHRSLFCPTDEKHLNTVKSLPIWRIYSSSPSPKFKAAKDCKLLPPKFPIFSLPSSEVYNILQISETERKFATLVGATNLSVEEYLKYNILPIENPLALNIIPEYTNLLRSILRECENENSLCRLLSQHSMFISDGVPNSLFQAAELYDNSNHLFNVVFAGAGKFIADSLQTHLPILRKIGLKCDVDGAAFIACASEVVHLSNLSASERPLDYLDRATMVSSYFSANFGSRLSLNATQIATLMPLEFLPIGRAAIDQLPSFTKQFIPPFKSLSSLSQLLSPQHLDIVWTQRPVHAENFNISSRVLKAIPSLHAPSVDIVLDHLHCLALSVSLHCSGDQVAFKKMLRKTYKYLENCSEHPDAAILIKERLSLMTPLFLNGDDPSDPNNWKPAKSLVIEADFDFDTGLFVVHDSLRQFENLLKLGGAERVVTLSPSPEGKKSESSTEAVFRKFEEFYHDSAADEYKDVVFIVDGEHFPAIRIFLAARSKYFCNMFLGGMMESRHDNLPVQILVEGISARTFCIMMEYLHTNMIKLRPEDADTSYAEGHPCRELQVYLKLLASSDQYMLDDLKQLVELHIVKEKMVRIETVEAIESEARLYHAHQLAQACRTYRENNQSLIERIHELKSAEK